MARLLAAIACAVAMAAIGASVVAAQPDNRLAFVDDRPLIMKWNELAAGISFPICNASTAQVQLGARLAGFKFTVADAPVRLATTLEPAMVPRSIGPLSCAAVRVKARGTRTPDPGTYTGVVAVFGPSGLLRRELTISVPKSGATPGEGRSVLEAVTLTARREALPPWEKTSELNHSRTLAFVPKVAGKQPPLPPPETLLGTLQHDDTGDRARVLVDGKPRQGTHGRLLLPIRVEGADKVGTYKGALGVAAGGADPIKVEATVKVGDWISLAIATIILGALLATIGLLWLQRWQPWLHLRRRRNRLTTTYEKAERAFESEFANKPFVSYAVTPTSVAAYCSDLKEALDRYRHNTFVFDRASEDYKKIVRMTQTAEDDAAVLADGAVGKSLSALQTSLKKFIEELAGDPDFQYPRGHPSFVVRAARLVWPTAPVKPGSDEAASAELAVGQPTSIASQADSYVALIGVWTAMSEKAKRYLRWTLYLQSKAGEMQWEDRRILASAAARIVEAKNEMFDAVDADELKSLETEADLQRAYGALAYLGARYGWSPPPSDTSFEELLERARVVELTERAQSRHYLYRAVETAPDVTPEQMAKMLAAESSAVGELPEINAALTETVARSIAWLGDAGALALALATGVVVGLVAFYDQETFGSLNDYLKALGLGAGATVIAKSLVETLAQIRRVERV